MKLRVTDSEAFIGSDPRRSLPEDARISEVRVFDDIASAGAQAPNTWIPIPSATQLRAARPSSRSGHRGGVILHCALDTSPLRAQA